MRCSALLVLFICLLYLPCSVHNGLAQIQECVDYRTLGGRFGLFAEATGEILLHEGFLYSCSATGLTVVNVADPMMPSYYGQVSELTAVALALDGNRLYALTSTGFIVLNVSDPGYPTVIEESGPPRLAEYEAFAAPVDIEPAGDTVYLSLGAAGIEVVDVSDPFAMDRIALISDGNEATMVSVEGDLAAVARNEDGWALYDVIDPADPTLIYETSADCIVDENGSICYGTNRVDLAGDRLLLGTYVHTIDSLDLDWVVTWQGHLQIVDVTDPTAPIFDGTCALGAAAPGDLISSGNQAYVLMPGTIVIADLNTNPASLTMLEGREEAISLDCAGTLIALGGPDIRLLRYPDVPTLDLRSETGYEYQSVAHQSSYSFAKGSALWYMDEFPIEENFISIFDTSDPSGPTFVTLHDASFGDRLDVLGEDLLQWQANGGYLRRVELDDPLNALPSELVAVDGAYVRTDDVAVSGAAVYVIRNGDLKVLDLSGEPALAAAYPSLGAQDLQPAGNMLYYLDEQGVRGFDLSDPLAPELLPPATTAVPVPVDAFLGKGGGWLVYRSGLDVGWLSVQPDGSLMEAGSIALTLAAVDAVVRESTLYVNTEWDANSSLIQAISLENPSAPVLLGVALANSCADLSATPQGMYLCTKHGFMTLPEQCPSGSSVDELPGPREILYLAGAVPTPFNPSTRVLFHLERPAEIQLYIYGIDGRLVARLADDRFPAGENHVVWHGCDDAGRAVASGVYFAYLQSGNQHDSAKLVMLR